MGTTLLNGNAMWASGQLKLSTSAFAQIWSADGYAQVYQAVNAFGFTLNNLTSPVNQFQTISGLSLLRPVFDGPHVLHPFVFTDDPIGRVRIQQEYGGTFSIRSIDLDATHFGYSQLVTFVGLKLNGETVAQIFQLDQNAGFQNFQFIGNFTDLRYVDMVLGYHYADLSFLQPGRMDLIAESVFFDNILLVSNNATFIGGSANDTIVGDAENNTIVGGANTISSRIGAAYTPAGAIGSNWTIIGANDTGGDGRADYVWTNAGKIAIWSINDGALAGAALVTAGIGADWTARTTGDFNNDGRADVLWTNTGRVAVWEMNGANVIAGGVSNGQIGANFSFRALGDFNGDGNSDVLWQSNTGQVAMWMMRDASIISGGLTSATIGTDWTIGGTGDFNNDGRDDVVWYNAAGQAATWLMNGTTVLSGGVSGTIGAGWRVGGIADFNMDGREDIAWYNPANNAVAIWHMNGSTVAGSTIISSGGAIGTDWKLSGVGDVTGDGRADIAWTRPNGSSVIWDLQGNGDVMTGGPGRDTFQFNALNELGKVITDFQAGIGGDVLSMRNLLVPLGYTGIDPLNDGELRLIQHGSATEVQVDIHPGQHDYLTLATLQNVTATSLVHDNFLI